MKTNELNANEMEQVSGGNFFADLEEVLRRIFGPKETPAPQKTTAPEPATARGKC